MDDLAKAIGVSKKTIYEKFKDKDELVLESVKYMLLDNQEKTEEAYKNSKNAIEQLISILQLMENMIRGLNMVCYIDMQKFYPKAFQYLQEHKKSFLSKCIVENLNQGIKENLYREDLNVEIVAKYRMESAMIVFQNNAFPQNEYDIVKVNAEVFLIYMYGITTEKGHKLISKYFNKKNK